MTTQTKNTNGNRNWRAMTATTLVLLLLYTTTTTTTTERDAHEETFMGALGKPQEHRFHFEPTFTTQKNNLLGCPTLRVYTGALVASQEQP